MGATVRAPARPGASPVVAFPSVQASLPEHGERHMAWIDRTPLILVVVGVFVLLLAAIEIGYRSYRWLSPKDDHKMGGQEFLATAVLGLLALLLGFTFSLALNRYDERRALVVQEANAIGTAWLRVQLLDDPYRGEMGNALKQYTDARVAWSDASSGDLGPTVALQEQVWTATRRLAHGTTSPVIVRGVLDPLNEAFDTQAARTAARSARIPGPVLATLLLYAALSMVLLGYIMAINGRRKLVPTVLLLLLLTLAFSVILDLDSPRWGRIQVSQQPLIDVRGSMR
jgi:hypothetical protein